MDKKSCNYCKIALPIYKFSINRKDEYNKSCDECRLKQKEVRKNNKCEHNREKSRCKDCGGSGICEHNRQKSSCKECGGVSICEHNKYKTQCKECGGSSICEHNKQKSNCKDCGGSSICKHNRQKSQCKECKNPVKITIKQWILNSKEKDKKYNKYDADHFIDKCFLEGLIEEYPTCYYEECKVDLQYVKYQNDLATIERMNNNIGHIKSNCVLCCMKCNNMKKSNKSTN